ncbi:MAG TPA: hypothetical protein VIV11_23875 [Kofleriaceae bacterium]
MSCPNPVELSRALIVGLDDRLRAHLEICTRCSEEIESHASVASATHDLPVAEPSHDQAWKLRVSLMAAARAPEPIAQSRMVWGFAAAGVLAAAAVLFVVVGREPQPQAQTVASILPHEGAAVMRVASGQDEIVRVAHGTVSVEVAQLAPNQRFRVVVGDAEVEGRGAGFDVTVDRDRLRGVRVFAGQVEIRAQGAPVKKLVAGERWQIELGRAELEPTPVAPVPEPPVDIVVEPTVDVVASIPAEKQHTKKHKSRRTDRPTEPQALSASESPARAAPARPKRPIEVLFEEGWTTLAAGNAAAASVIFERAAQAAPKDPLAEDAWFWRASSLARAKSGAAASAFDSFLSRYPSSPRVGEASAMLGWLVIDSDLDRAEKLFKASANDRVASVRASAARGLTAIEQRRKR